MITIVDYGVGNLASIHNMLDRLDVRSEITSDRRRIAAAEKLILPGVGAFDYGMASLRERGFVDLLHRKARVEQVPILGICLGCQLFTRRSEEGREEGLGWLDAETVAFDRARLSPQDRIPHMGWSEVSILRESRIFSGLAEEARFYFVHSFHLRCPGDGAPIGSARHGYAFTAAVEKENVVGVQFHPEKSHKFGMRVLLNFAEQY